MVKKLALACVDGRSLDAMQGMHACVASSMQTHARRSKGAISLRIYADATPQEQSLDKKFSAGGQAKRDITALHLAKGPSCRSSRCIFDRFKKTAQKKWFSENPIERMRASLARACQCKACLDHLDAPHCDGGLKKNCKRVLTVKKSVIRFRPADVAAKESEQNRHQADTLVPDVHRSAIHGGVGSASLQKSSSRSDQAPVSPFDAGVSVSVPSRITCGWFPTTACRRGVWFNWAFHLHSSLTRSQLHGH
ncbi:hypothetical protein NYR97_01590 [Xanthomonas hydrangeae]|uniref:Uncharacterized protein n=1 Tax=Xanthomonas hydrangeae TaxID=2775159 RepID=A0AAU0BB51_9XANT|nr:hypothetical protein [Xanthomonas hydrangeae]WOB50142.1 hypothetical protein NYR97_01590 [Xanthomonas hydrangeae]